MQYVTRTAGRYNKAACPELGSPTTLPCHGRFAAERPTARREQAAGVAKRMKRTARSIVIADVELKRVEDALLDALLDTHANADNALDRLLGDMEMTEAGERNARTDDYAALEAVLARPSKKSRIEELLVAAVLDNHPNRNAALDRIFDDLQVLEEEAARYNMSVDNDFDGLA